MVNPNCASTDGYPSLPSAWGVPSVPSIVGALVGSDALMDELFDRNTADRVAEGHRGIRGDQQGSWPCMAAAAPRMHAFERRGAATDKRPRSNPNSSTTSDREFVVASMSKSTMHRHASQPAPRCFHGGAAAPADRPRLQPRRPTTSSLCRKSLAKPRKGHFKIECSCSSTTSSLRLKSIRAKQLQDATRCGFDVGT